MSSRLYGMATLQCFACTVGRWGLCCRPEQLQGMSAISLPCHCADRNLRGGGRAHRAGRLPACQWVSGRSSSRGRRPLCPTTMQVVLPRRGDHCSNTDGWEYAYTQVPCHYRHPPPAPGCLHLVLWGAAAGSRHHI
jgi:hypothetical protein